MFFVCYCGVVLLFSTHSIPKQQAPSIKWIICFLFSNNNTKKETTKTTRKAKESKTKSAGKETNTLKSHCCACFVVYVSLLSCFYIYFFVKEELNKTKHTQTHTRVRARAHTHLLTHLLSLSLSV